ncbi:MAG: hypothetical protein WD845_06180 [Pirellulales bacterium]
MRTTLLWIASVACVCLAAWSGPLAAQPVPPPDAAEESEAPDAASQDDKPASANPLSDRQRQVRQRFVELERLLLRMAELTAPTDPHRAALLRQAVAQSKQRDIDHQFEELVKLLEQQQLSLAVRGQGEVQRDLARLLELLLSEDRGKRIESEKERVREYLKRVNKIIKEQKAVQGETNRDGDTKELAERQGELSDKTGELAGDVKQEQADRESLEREPDDQDKPNDGDSDAESEKQAEKNQDAEDKPGDQPEQDAKKPADDEKGDKPQESEKSENKSDQPAEPGDPSESPPSQSPDPPPMPGAPMPGESPPGESPPPSDNPAQQRLEKAQQRMQQAQEKLKQAEREQADEKQAEALRELEQAKAELEEILRQLREEETARMLAVLEGRFRKMLDAQVQVYEGTVRVDQVPEKERDRDDEIEAGRLSRMEAAIVVEADKCLSLLREEGSAVAFPEAVVDMREDMQQVVERLAEASVGPLTQGIETDIITALEEMIAALKKAQKDNEEKQQQGDPGQSQPGEPPLVDTLAELRMIRALQMRVNNRTQTYAKLIEAEQADTPELLEALKRLAEREQRIHAVTRDIVIGRNQ